MAFDLSSYVDVKTRVKLFYKQFPDGRLTFEFMGQLPGNPQMMWGIAKAYRTADDPTPCTGVAAELIEGRTPYTRGSELQNLETSAWGRCLAAAGIGIDNSMASMDEVIHAEHRQKRPESPTAPANATVDPWEAPVNPETVLLQGLDTFGTKSSFYADGKPKDMMSEAQRKMIYAICKENTETVVKNYKAKKGIDPTAKFTKKEAVEFISEIKENGFADWLEA